MARREIVSMVSLTKEERQKMLELLSLGTDKALKTKKNFRLHNPLIKNLQNPYGISYLDLDELYTPKDNGYGIVVVMNKDYEFERESRIGTREREILEKNRMALFDYPYYYTVTNSITKNVGYGTVVYSQHVTLNRPQHNKAGATIQGAP